MSDQLDYETLRRRAEKRVKVRRGFRTHLSWYVVVNLCCWAIWFLTPHFTPEFPWPFMLTLTWGIGIVFHAIAVYQKSGMAEVRRELEIEREIQRELDYRGIDHDSLSQKAKRAVRLSDDGELVEVEDNAEDANHISSSARR